MQNPKHDISNLNKIIYDYTLYTLPYGKLLIWI